MNRSSRLLLLLLPVVLLLLLLPRSGCSAQAQEWVVRLEGGPQVAALLALRSGYSHLGPVLGFKDTYLWRALNGPQHEKRAMPTRRAMSALADRAQILWADRQRPLNRQKRGYQQLEPPRTRRAFNDELWEQEWYLPRRKSSAIGDDLDLNVLPVYKLGITGRGVRVVVLDDGLEYTHEDLRANYDPEISYDVTDRDDDPIPRYEEPDANGHGTRCAGEIAMEANNRKCGVGVAFEARIGGVKMLDGVVNDRVEAESLGYRRDLVDIYTASWGPPDDGRSLEAPGRLASEALERGILEGRSGLGSIFVWASGNGGTKHDDCGCDGYVGSIYTLAIGSASETGSFPWYGEICPATLATTYSSGALDDQMIATTDLKNTCTTRHTGTSASAPLAAGILALAMQVNKNLTWRDVQHLVVYTSEFTPLRNNPGWFSNAAGLRFNPRFGFGLMDAYALVTASSNWTNVPDKLVCEVLSPAPPIREISYGLSRRVQFIARTGDCSEIRYLEHVQVETSIEYSVRGALQIQLTAPSGTTVQILGRRKHDGSQEGFLNWTFMSVATWGEDPRGAWFLDIRDEVGPAHNNGTIGHSKLILHGTKQRPQYLDKSFRDDVGSFDQGDKLNYLNDGESNLLPKQESEKNRSGLDDDASKKDWLVRFLLS